MMPQAWLPRLMCMVCSCESWYVHGPINRCQYCSPFAGWFENVMRFRAYMDSGNTCYSSVPPTIAVSA